MPIFEYKCKKCGNIAEFLQKNAKKTQKCPKCGSPQMEKQFSSFACTSGKSNDMSEHCEQCPSQGGCQTGMCPYTAG